MSDPLDTPLSPHFALREFCQSDTAIRHDIDMSPSTAVEMALAELVTSILEPLRLQLGTPIKISSGYRPLALNQLIGGASNSQHILGQAADIKVEGMTPLQVCTAIMRARLPFDQLIHEFGAWTHVSHIPHTAQRGQVLTALRQNGHAVYLPGLPQ